MSSFFSSFTCAVGVCFEEFILFRGGKYLTVVWNYVIGKGQHSGHIVDDSITTPPLLW